MKFPKPLITLMDIEDDIENYLLTEGYNIQRGRFGIPYQIATSSITRPLWDNSYFPPRLFESEVVVIDLSIRNVLPSPSGEQMFDKEGRPILVKSSSGIVDPCPFHMLTIVDKFDRILEHGGIFIVFAEPKNETELVLQDRFVVHEPIKINNWSFLSKFADDNFQATNDEGTQIQITTTNEILGRIVKQYSDVTKFTATLRMFYSHGTWRSIATNKFDEIVSGALITDSGGCVLVFPHVNDKAGFLLSLLEDVLPEIAPDLFPFIEEKLWITQDTYQPPRVSILKKEMQQVQDVAKKKVEELQKEIEAEQASHQYLADLLTQTDTPLVDAVKQSLEVLGFRDVVNYDEVLEAQGETDMREDLHIKDISPLVLVEVKGVKGTSTEDEALQVVKYLFPRAQELGRTDLRGLSVINHQRHLPPMDRRPQPFTADVLKNAENPKTNLGLLTTWNLYKLVRNFLKHGWTHEEVAGLFYKNGFVEPIPMHYKYIGTVERFIESKGIVGIQINESELCLGDRIAFELPIEFEEQIVGTLEFENKAIEIAKVGMLVGMQTPFSKTQLREKVRVFRVEKSLSL